MKKFYIVAATDFVDYNTGKQNIGGVQTYIRNLALLAIELNFDVTVFQLADCPEEKNIIFDGIKVQYVKAKRRQNQKPFDAIYQKYNTPDSVFVIATDMMNVTSKASNVIAINHGITFDYPGYNVPGFLKKTRLLQHIGKYLRCTSNLYRFYRTRNTVCVDYNFYNWFRTLGTVYPEKKVRVIPNYASDFISEEAVKEKLAKRGEVKKVVFARRFVEHRGTLLFAKAVNELQKKYQFDVTFAGGGPDEEALKERFKNNPSVHFTIFSASESIEFHKQFDIAVVPTIYSEGTSLSLCEAMSAGCFPISSYVGGLSNILLDHYNGLMCLPEQRDLVKSLEEALTMNDQDFDAIVNNAYWSARKAFSLDLWKKKWAEFIKDVM